jgi:methylenetetrahydrofolate reductase (NADPH)
MNQGIYLDEDLKEVAPTDFCIGVAGYPEKHFEAPNFKTDLKYLKMKVDAGAEYIVTQMFFDNKAYFDFVQKCRDAGIDVPIIPGLKPITTRGQLTTLPSIFHIDIPDELMEEIENCKDDKHIKNIGIEWGIKQTRELIEFGVPCLHFYTMGRSEVTKAIAQKVF